MNLWTIIVEKNDLLRRFNKQIKTIYIGHLIDEKTLLESEGVIDGITGEETF